MFNERLSEGEKALFSSFRGVNTPTLADYNIIPVNAELGRTVNSQLRKLRGANSCTPLDSDLTGLPSGWHRLREMEERRATARIWTQMTRRTENALPESLAFLHSQTSWFPERNTPVRLRTPWELIPGLVLPVSSAPSTQPGVWTELNKGQMQEWVTSTSSSAKQKGNINTLHG